MNYKGTEKKQEQRTTINYERRNLYNYMAIASLVSQMVKSLPTMWETRVQSLDQEDPLEKEIATHSSSCLENPMDGGAWWAAVHGVTESRTRLSNFTFFHFTVIWL